MIIVLRKWGEIMPNFEKMYFELFNTITDVLELLENGKVTNAMIRLAAVQCKTEEMYCEEDK